MTAPGWAPCPLDRRDWSRARDEVRRDLGIPPGALVFGLIGSIAWVRRAGYCYGLELARALRRVDRPDVWALVVGDGSGLDRLRGEAGPRCVLAGRVDREAVPRHLAAMDVASLPQSLDGVGLFRYTTKLPEYLAAGLPVVTGRLPFAYDLDDGWAWRIPGRAPWDDRYVEALAGLMTRLGPEELALKRDAVPRDPPEFDRARQADRVADFLGEILADG